MTYAQDASERTIVLERQGFLVKDITGGKIAGNLLATLSDLRRYKYVKISLATQGSDWNSNYQMVCR